MQIPGYYRVEGPYLRLQGQQCHQCNAKQFPPNPTCRGCGGTELDACEMSGAGVVASFSEIGSPPSGFSYPFIAALVTLAEGMTIAAQLTDIEPEDVKIGLAVEMTTRRISETGAEGCLIYGYKFRPRHGD
jgi:uncharacterized OB-fold protein